MIHSSARTPSEYVSTGLQDLMAVQNFTSAAVETPNNPGSSNGGNNQGSGSGSGSNPGSSSNTGAIVGGVVGGVAAIAIVALAGFFIMRRRKQRAAAGDLQSGHYGQEMPANQAPGKHEMADTSNAGTPMANNIVYAKHAPPPPPQQQYEMPTTEDRRHELP